MKKIEGKSFEMWQDRTPGSEFADITLSNNFITNCFIAQNYDPASRTKISRITALHNHVHSSNVGPAICEEILVDGLRVDDILICWGTLFKHTTLKGRILGELKINIQANPIDYSKEKQRPFDEARRKFYEGIDWALDITEIECNAFDFDGIPARLVKRDPETQFVFNKKHILKLNGWRDKVTSKTYWADEVEGFLEGDEEDLILIAPKAKPKKKYLELLDGLKELRDLGVAEPN